MSDNDKRMPPHPSQAEGTREVDSDVPGGQIAPQPEPGKDVSRQRPSQAEGSERIVEQSLHDQNNSQR